MLPVIHWEYSAITKPCEIMSDKIVNIIVTGDIKLILVIVIVVCYYG